MEIQQNCNVKIQNMVSSLMIPSAVQKIFKAIIDCTGFIRFKG